VKIIRGIFKAQNFFLISWKSSVSFLKKPHLVWDEPIPNSSAHVAGGCHVGQPSPGMVDGLNPEPQSPLEPGKFQSLWLFLHGNEGSSFHGDGSCTEG
jgi:hypothetical protein